MNFGPSPSVLWLRRLVAYLSPWSHGFNPRSALDSVVED